MSFYRSRSSSASEGEIIESGPRSEAIQSRSSVKDNNVDRNTRQIPSLPRSPSLTRGSRRERSPLRSSSPYQSRRERRKYESDYDSDRNRLAPYGRSRYSRHGPRDYERPERGHDRDYGRRNRGSYHDYDSHSHGHGARDRRIDRSRSPYRDPRKPKRYSDDEDERETRGSAMQDTSRESVQNGTARSSSLQQAVNEQQRPTNAGTSHQTSHFASETAQNRSREVTFAEGTNGPEADKTHPSEQTMQDGVHATGKSDVPQTSDSIDSTEEPLDEAAMIEQRRKKREAILAKYRQSQPSQPESAPSTVQAAVAQSNGNQSFAPPPASAASDLRSTVDSQADLSSVPPTPAVIHVSRDEELANTSKEPGTVEQGEASAVDYDPTLEMNEDKLRHDKRHFGSELPSQAYDETKTPKHDVTFDMFAEDEDDDMFADTPPQTAQTAAKPSTGQELDVSMMDNWDDPQGYYNVMLGELINGRYHVTQNLGKGMFSSVVRAIDSHTNKPVAVKIIRNNDTMRKAGMKEIEILQQLKDADPEDRKHVIRFECHFDHKGHLCIVFENLSMNLREVLKKFGRDVGINLKAIRVYAHQMFLGLSLFRKCGILHADLKPDNLLVNESRNILKVCDLGSASSASENEITPYLVSRFYRAPEIILGIPYDYAIDMWSIGCTLYELYTGKILFTGRTNNQMLRAMMECRGQFPPKFLRKGTLTYAHFDDLLNFRSVEEDKITGRVVTKMMTFKKPTKDLKSRLIGKESGRMSDADAKELNLFVDLLDKCLNLNPEKRCTPAEALKHPFIYRGGI
ncbi:Protein kinase-like domain protein [Ascosphaera apis ARSEF 7405]|uniref:non-specific serine/threonine protein kinase n=1 Tax=Ascosphaera apis ARSEF 7405 TaxID=392613 RepID=A0A162IMT9_9EURO|nr:Protein kinase-like domain protein [Ascosphaera apis ARSEF 7405]